MPPKMHFAGPTKCIFMLPEGREQCLAGLDIALVPTALRKLWAVRCPRRLQTCVLSRLPEMHFATCFQAAGSVEFQDVRS